LGGHILSLNQAFLLTLAVREASGRREAVSGINRIALSAATLKALSPAGKRLTPMLAISAQGVLFSIGLVLLGVGLPGVLLGGALLSLWGFAQPILIAYLIYGETFFAAVLKLAPQAALALLITGVALKLAASFVVVSLGWKCDEAFESKYLAQLKNWSERYGLARPKAAHKPSMGALRDLASPWFLAGTALSVGFFALNENAQATQVVFYGLRVLACAWLLFWAVRAIPGLKKFRNHADGDLGRVIASQFEPDRATKPRDGGVTDPA
jgi:hypothetical protein